MIRAERDDVENRYKQLGYRWFDDPFDLNLFGIRSPDVKRNDQFRDAVGIAWRDHLGDPRMLLFSATTVAGDYYLTHPMNRRGTGIIKPDQYRLAYKLGLHKAKPALVQVAPFAVYRDPNRDTFLDYRPNTIQTGMFAMNMHRAHPTRITTRIGRWSAGCQVFQNPNELDMILSLVRTQALAGLGTHITYTLLDKW